MPNRLTPFERAYLLTQPFLTYHRYRVMCDLQRLTASYPTRPRLLDIGARSSHYTIGLRADVVLLDVPRVSDQQRELNLGVTDTILQTIQKRRSNIVDYIIVDFLKNDLPDASYDLVTAIEVIEHIKDDHAFVAQVYRLLKPGGVFYLTTPNARVIPHINPDHVRQYTAEMLEAVLASAFDDWQVVHGEINSKSLAVGRGFWQPRRPHRIIMGAVANLITRIENHPNKTRPDNTTRLFATVRK